MRKTPLVLVICLLAGNLLTAQNLSKKKYKHDSNYYEMYPNKLTGRIYAAKKFEDINVPSGGSATDLKYVANHKTNFGIGVTWRNYSLNAFYGFNNSSANRGKTKGLDLQLHLFPHKWVIDVLAVMPKGMYIKPKGTAAASSSSYYSDKETKERIYGVAAYRVPNKEKFSYRAALVQNEWQKKSAGSVLYGLEAYYVIGPENDSTFIPKAIQDGYAEKGFLEMRYLSIGPGIGYAYTAVMDQHFFIMGSLIANLKVNVATEETPDVVKETSIAPSSIYKAAIGYNSDNWSFVISTAGNLLWGKGPASAQTYFYKAGQVKVSLAKKFDVKKKEKK
ncbi:MAG TPA: DUF4421 family protein [Chitinophagaceae bacterium]|nr:DUF4421 family protein [Chitinophagaceae bacterium]